MKVTVHRLRDGSLSLVDADGSEPLEAELRDGYRVEESSDGSNVRVVGPLGEFAMTAEEAARAGLLQLPLFK